MSCLAGLGTSGSKRKEQALKLHERRCLAAILMVCQGWTWCAEVRSQTIRNGLVDAVKYIVKTRRHERQTTFPASRPSGLLGFGGDLAVEGTKITAAFQQDVGSGHTHPGTGRRSPGTPSKLRLPARAVPSGIDSKSISGSPTSAQAAANRLSPSRPGSRRVLPYLLARKGWKSGLDLGVFLFGGWAAISPRHGGRRRGPAASSHMRFHVQQRYRPRTRWELREISLKGRM